MSEEAKPATPTTPQTIIAKPCAGCDDGPREPGNPSAPAAKAPPHPILCEWLFVYWIGTPKPIRWLDRERYKDELGCGCPLRTRRAWLALKRCWRPRAVPSRVVTTPYGTSQRPMTKRELEQSVERSLQRAPMHRPSAGLAAAAVAAGAD